MNKCNIYVKPKHTRCISIDKIPKCQLCLFTPLSFTLPTENPGIVLQAGKVLVHLVLLWGGKVPSLFYSTVCWETSERNWSVEWQKSLHSGCRTEGLYEGAAHLLGAVRFRRCCGEGMPWVGPGWWGPKAGHSCDSSGCACDTKTMQIFRDVGCQVKTVSHLAPLFQIDNTVKQKIIEEKVTTS